MNNYLLPIYPPFVLGHLYYTSLSAKPQAGKARPFPTNLLDNPCIPAIIDKLYMAKGVRIMKVPSEIKSIKRVSSKILSSLSSYELNKDTLFDIRLCTEEAVRNAIVHGSGLRKGSRVSVYYWVDKGKLHIEIEDEGAGFDSNTVPDPTENSNILKKSGRGVYLIKKFMDRVSFNEKGNKIKMEKALLSPHLNPLPRGERR